FSFLRRFSVYNRHRISHHFIIIVIVEEIRMAFNSYCTRCGAVQRIADGALGKQFRCARCGESFVAQADRASSPEAPIARQGIAMGIAVARLQAPRASVIMSSGTKPMGRVTARRGLGLIVAAFVVLLV